MSKWRCLRRIPLAICLVAVCFGCCVTYAQDPLPSWNDSAAKTALIDFVDRVTYESDDDGYYVPPKDRIAVFDNDGTLWCEQPFYSQFAFAIDQVKLDAAQHPEWQEKEPFKSILAGDLKLAFSGGEKALLELVAATHANITTDEFNERVRTWLKTAHHPRFHQPYNKCVYQPMIEVLDYLRANGFKTFIVSGGGAEFMRVWAEEAYGIPPQQVIGSCGKLKFEMRDGKPILLKLPAVDFVDDGPGKPVGIQRFIGQQPIIAFGNSDGDYEMLEYTTSGATKPRLGLLVHHTDAVREYAYDHPSKVGQLERGLEQAQERGWIVIDMKNDWKKIFPFQE